MLGESVESQSQQPASLSLLGSFGRVGRLLVVWVSVVNEQTVEVANGKKDDRVVGC